MSRKGRSKYYQIGVHVGLPDLGDPGVEVLDGGVDLEVGGLYEDLPLVLQQVSPGQEAGRDGNGAAQLRHLQIHTL